MMEHVVFKLFTSFRSRSWWWASNVHHVRRFRRENTLNHAPLPTPTRGLGATSAKPPQ